MVPPRRRRLLRVSARSVPALGLAAILHARIESPEITPGSQASVLSGRGFGLVPVTIRKAVRLLRDEGLVRRVTGMGTYVVES